MNAWIVAVGSELLTPFKVDTNSLAITRLLNTIGCRVRFKAVVGDNLDDLIEIFRRAMGATDVLICTGGLGPTEDDLTREALSRALQLPLDEQAPIVAAIRERFHRRGVTMPENNRRQAMVPRGAVVIENTRGTAPGLWLAREDTSIALLPGPSREMLPMLEHIVEQLLKPRTNGGGVFRRAIRITGRSESEVDALSSPIYAPWAAAAIPIETTILAAMGQIELHLTAVADDAAAGGRALDAAVGQLVAVLGDSVYSRDGRPIEAILGELLAARGETLAVAESCTGGLLSSRLTDIPGSSAYFERGAVCYSNDAKTAWLGVPRELIAAHGAVSEPVAMAMARGVRAAAGTDAGIGITGIAGPDGGTDEKPVGTVVIAVVRDGQERVRTFRFLGARDMVKSQSALTAMNMLRLLLLEPEGRGAALD